MKGIPIALIVLMLRSVNKVKRIVMKRLVYIGQNGETHIGGDEYDGNLSDANILNSVHEIGKTTWINGILWLLKNNNPTYMITVNKFYYLLQTLPLHPTI